MNEVNYLAILTCGVAYWIIGGIWYAAVLSKQYQESLGFSDAEKERAQKNFPKSLLAHFISGLITSFALALVIQAMAITSFGGGLLVGLLIWLGFAFTINLNYLMFERRPAALFLINSGFFLVSFPIMGGVLAVW